MAFPMSPVDSMFLAIEAAHRPMNIGALALLAPPDGGDAAQVGGTLTAALARNQVAPFWRRRPRRSVASLGQWYWHTDAAADVDLDYHVQFDALPEPGDMAELWKLISRLHSGTLDRERPLWRVHLIEGLADGRYAVYTKVHHALTDGASALRLLHRSCSPDPEQRGMPALWEATGPEVRDDANVGTTVNPFAAVQGWFGVAAQATGVVSALVDTAWRALRGRSGPLTLAAPHTPFSTPIGAERSLTGCAFPLERLRLAAKHTDATINDVVLTMCAGALRRYLLSRNALPAAPLIAMVPVSLRGGELTNAADTPPGNKVAALMCPLATDLDDPIERLARIQADMADGKTTLAGRSQLQTLAASALGAAPLALTMLLGHTVGPLRPPNVMISTIAGPEEPLYWNGARLDALYPLSVPVDGQILNITCTSINSQIMFGMTGCSRSIPEINILTSSLGQELDLLDTVHRISRTARNRRRALRPHRPPLDTP